MNKLARSLAVFALLSFNSLAFASGTQSKAASCCAAKKETVCCKAEKKNPTSCCKAAAKDKKDAKTTGQK